MTHLEIDVPTIRIRHANGVETFEPNGLIGTLIQDPFAFTLLAPTEKTSIISGAPALLYDTDEVNLPLTAAEIYRLVMSSLRPAEVLALRSRFRDFFEIHGDFYDPRTGQALQPKIEEDPFA